MAKMTKGHFHCIECDSLFQATVLASGKQICPQCGQSPTGKRVSDTLGLDSREATDFEDSQVRQQYESHSKRKKKKPKSLIVIFSIWIALIVLAVGVAQYFKEDSNSEFDAERRLRQDRLVAERQNSRRIIQDAIEECESSVRAFINSKSAGAKAQFVYRGRELTVEMDRYYRHNPIYVSEAIQVKLLRAELLKNVSNQIITAIFANNHQEFFEVVLIRSDKKWKLDWQSFVRVNSRPWALFSSAENGEEGEFRLYMRVRDSNKGLEAEVINLVFYKPQIYLKAKYKGESSVNVSVLAESEVGKKILQLVRSREEGEPDLYKTGGNLNDPPGYYRVRVKMKLHEEEKESRIELLDIVANHWFGNEALGTEEASNQ